MLHEAKILHLDVKPTNIIMSPDGATLIDLGISRHQDEYNSAIFDDTLGTAAYLAPEQWRRGGKASPATDIWSLGVTLFEIATGYGPLGNDNMSDTQFIEKIRSHEPIKMPDSVGRDLRNIIEKCLSKNPELRYQTVTSLEDELERAEKQCEIQLLNK